jgi:hypothetical protein
MLHLETDPFIWKSDIPYPCQEDMPEPEGIKRLIAHDGREDILPFLHDVAITWFKGFLYVAWYNSTDAEICGTSLIRYRRSGDSGNTWSEPFTLVGSLEAENEHYVPATFFPNEGRLYAFVTEMSGKNITTALDLYVMTGDTKIGWEKVSCISGGFITNAPPVPLKNGNYAMGAWIPMKDETPAFPVVLISDGGDIEKPWRISFLYDPMRPGAVCIRCPEISLHAEGPYITAYIRNDEGPSYVFNSYDYAENWQIPRINPMHIGNSKIFAGKLSDGRKYIIYNEERGYFVRTLLVIAVADAGSSFYNRVYKIFNDYEPQIGRGKTWFYPSAYESDSILYIACTLQEPKNIRSAVMAKVPIASL